MTSCQEYIERISDLLDGELSSEERLRLAEHARSCPACGVRLETMRQTLRLLADDTLWAPPVGAGERLHAALDRVLQAPLPAARDPLPAAPIPIRRLGWWRQPGWLLAAAVVLICIGGFQWWQQARVRTWQGWLIDAHCAAKYRAAGKLPAAHPRWCALEPPCLASGYGVYTAAGHFVRFDTTGSTAALAMLRTTSETSDLRVTVRGRERGGLIHPLRLTLDPPGGNALDVRYRVPDLPVPLLAQGH